MCSFGSYPETRRWRCRSGRRARKAKDIVRRDVIALLDGIVERGAPIAANRTLAVLRKKRLSGDSPYLFPSPRIGYITPTAVDHAVRRNLLVFGIKHFTPHDLRRTAASHMTGALGIFRLVVLKILNHVEAGVTSVYDRHSYDLNKQKALEAWGARLEQLLEADTPSVIYLKRR